MIGPITVKLFASSTAVDTDFTAKLVDVYPPSEDYPSGYEMNITDGILRARCRNSPERPGLMPPDVRPTSCCRSLLPRRGAEGPGAPGRPSPALPPPQGRASGAQQRAELADVGQALQLPDPGR